MRRKILLLFIIFVLTSLLSVFAACLFEHSHNFEYAETIEPTCENDGYEVYRCICGQEQKKRILRLFHSYKETGHKDASCTEAGYTDEKCDRCGKTNHTVLPRLPHQVDPEEPGLEPTCTEPGYYPAGECQLCHKHIDRVTRPALGHIFDEGHCTVCGAAKTYTVNYYLHYDDSGLVETPQAKTYSHGDKFESIEPSEIPDGKIFVGWYNLDFTHQYDENTIITGDMDVVAKFMNYRRISTPDQLLEMGKYTDTYFELMNNINMQGKTWTPIEKFDGIFDGKQYRVYNFFVANDSVNSDYAMFVVNSGKIANLELNDITYNVKISCGATTNIGVLVAQNSGEITNCTLSGGTMQYTVAMSNSSQPFHFGTIAAFNTGKVTNCACSINLSCDSTAEFSGTTNTGGTAYNTTNMYTAGIVGRNEGTVSGCHYDGTVTLSTKSDGNIFATGWGYWTRYYQTTNYFFGGVVGVQSHGTLTNSYANVNYLHEHSVLMWHGEERVGYENCYAGGLVGANTESGQVSNCFANGTLYDKSNDNSTVGGLVALNNGNATVSSCHSAAETNANGHGVAGGLIGENSATVQDSYACGNVYGNVDSIAGGLVGKNTDTGNIGKCYCTGNVSIQAGTADYVLGSHEGTMLKCYYLEGATVQSNGKYVETAHNGEARPYRTLWTTDFLVNELYWDESGWVVLMNENPMLDWEISVGHIYNTTEVPPTCEDFGYTVYTCEDCGRIFVRDYVVPTGHQQSRIVSQQQAKCEQAGIIVYHCDACGNDFEVETEQALKHKPTIRPGDERVEPSCKYVDGEYVVTEGHTAKITCSVCNETISASQPIEPHKFYVESSLSEKPGCTTEGKNHLVCSVCGFSKDVTVPATGHTMKSGTLVCATCGEEIWDESLFTKIGNVDALKEIANGLNGTYMLTADIDLQNQPWTPIGSESQPFTGVVYGNGHKIKNLLQTDLTYGGIFGCNRGEIVGLTVENVDISITNVDNVQLGVIAAINGGKIRECTVVGNVHFGVYVARTADTFSGLTVAHYATLGGIAATNNASGTVAKCTVNATITVDVTNEFTNTAKVDLAFYLHRGWKQELSKFVANVTVGGIVGNNGGKVENCTMSGNLDVNVTQNIYIERTVNEGKWSEVKYKAGKMELSTDVYEGSLAGYNTGIVVDSKANGCTLTKLVGTQDDNSNFFSMTHLLNRLVNTATDIVELVPYSTVDGVCDNLQKLA